MFTQIYPTELQLNKANSTDAETPFIEFHFSISNDFVSFNIYNKCD